VKLCLLFYFLCSAIVVQQSSIVCMDNIIELAEDQSMPMKTYSKNKKTYNSFIPESIDTTNNALTPNNQQPNWLTTYFIACKKSLITALRAKSNRNAITIVPGILILTALAVPIIYSQYPFEYTYEREVLLFFQVYNFLNCDAGYALWRGFSRTALHTLVIPIFGNATYLQSSMSTAIELFTQQLRVQGVDVDAGQPDFSTNSSLYTTLVNNNLVNRITDIYRNCRAESCPIANDRYRFSPSIDPDVVCSVHTPEQYKTQEPLPFPYAISALNTTVSLTRTAYSSEVLLLLTAALTFASVTTFFIAHTLASLDKEEEREKRRKYIPLT
jgi:hypothetical protein